MLKTFTIAAAFLIGTVAHASSVTFVSPLEGAQMFGPQTIEITTDAAGVDRVDFYVDGILAGVARTPPWRIAYDFGTSATVRDLSAKVWSNGFTVQNVAAMKTGTLTANETMNVELVEVPLRVRSSRVIRPSDLRVRENGVEQTIRDIRRERPAAHFAFVIDRSLSMNEGKLDAALRAVQSELTQLRNGDTASLVFFNHHVAKAEAISPGEDLVSKFGGTVPSGGTSLRDALASVSSSDRTYAIVITDGGDRNSELSDEEALRRISGTKTVVNALVMGSSHARFLDRAATNTGGSVVRASTVSVGSELSRLLSDINSRYLVIYQSRGTERGWRSIEVKARRRGVQVVTARRGYFAE